MSIRMKANLYKCHATTTNALPTIRMACDWLKYVSNSKEYVLVNFRSMFLIFVTPQNRAWMLTKAYECFANIANWWRIAFVSPFVRYSLGCKSSIDSSNFPGTYRSHDVEVQYAGQ